MKCEHRTLTRRVTAAIAAGTTTFALFSAVIAISEPHRSGLAAANAARHATHARAQAEPPQVMSIAEAANDPEVGHHPTQREGAGQTAAGHIDGDSAVRAW